MIRSILSIPGHRLDMVEKARLRGADQIAWDLEDSVPLSEKALALNNVLINARPGDAVRIYAGLPLAALAALPAGVMLNVPKAVGAGDLRALRATGRPLLAVIESPAAVRRADEICAEANAVAFGRADFQAATGLADPACRLIEHAMAEIAMAAQAAGIPAYDSPCEDFRSERAMAAEVKRAKSFGFTGKICIHPSQIHACAAFAPLADLDLAGRRGAGACEIGGVMYAEPHFKLAQRLAGGAS